MTTPDPDAPHAVVFDISQTATADYYPNRAAAAAHCPAGGIIAPAVTAAESAGRTILLSGGLLLHVRRVDTRGRHVLLIGRTWHDEDEADGGVGWCAADTAWQARADMHYADLTIDHHQVAAFARLEHAKDTRTDLG